MLFLWECGILCYLYNWRKNTSKNLLSLIWCIIRKIHNAFPLTFVTIGFFINSTHFQRSIVHYYLPNCTNIASKLYCQIGWYQRLDQQFSILSGTDEAWIKILTSVAWMLMTMAIKLSLFAPFTLWHTQLSERVSPGFSFQRACGKLLLPRLIWFDDLIKF